ncbi:MAG TPA: HEAT repeat domain-containing protein [Gemmatimonadaceae bacterium]|nr:HEAT repeat domain-containing protein [Gemmatimonadaceae bacterium]
MTTPSAPLSAPELERIPPFEPTLVEELLRLFGKAARAHQLYLPNNPVYKSAHDALRTGFAPVWAETDELVLSFTESEVKWEGHTVLTEGSRGSESLPWLFYKDGVREIRLLRGFEVEELDKLLGILQRVRKASPDEDDLLTLLWEGDFVFLRYRYVDLALESATAMTEGEPILRDDAEPEEEAGEAEEQPTRAGVVSMSDFDGTLYFLDEREIEYLQTEVDREYRADLRQNVVAILLDIFEQQSTPAVREEISELLDVLMLHMLSAGQFQNVAYLIRESQAALERAPELLPEQRERVALIPSRLSAPETLSQLLQSLDESESLPPLSDLLQLFEQLRGPALATVLEWFVRLQNPKLRPMLEQAATRLASQNTADLVKLILSPMPGVGAEAIRRAGLLKTPAAVAPLTRVLADGEPAMRVAAVQALGEIGTPGALQALERGVDDAERDVRIAAIRALGGRAYRPVLPKLDAIVKGKAIRDADLTEKMAAFEAYGGLCGDDGVSALDAMLNGKSMFGRREDSELRACAAVALGRVNTKGAQESLRRAANEKDVVVRNAVNRALRGVTA